MTWAFAVLLLIVGIIAGISSYSLHTVKNEILDDALTKVAAECVAACPTGAMQQRPKDGIVFVDPELCVGCKTCISACPWGAPQWNPETGKVTKCDYCMDRIDAGLRPACVTICTTHCLDFGKVEDMTQIRRERHARSVTSLG